MVTPTLLCIVMFLNNFLLLLSINSFSLVYFFCTRLYPHARTQSTREYPHASTHTRVPTRTHAKHTRVPTRTHAKHTREPTRTHAKHTRELTRSALVCVNHAHIDNYPHMPPRRTGTENCNAAQVILIAVSKHCKKCWCMHIASFLEGTSSPPKV